MDLTSAPFISPQDAPNMYDPLQPLPATTFSLGSQSTHESPTSATSNTASPLLGPGVRKRRNGLQPACEPCRRAKVRCDTSPPGSLCSRCRKRKTASQCIFLDAPMTRQFRGPSNGPGLSLPSPQSPPRSRHRGLERGVSSTAATPSSPTVARKVAGPSGFLGLTSFSATFRDHETAVTSKEAETDPTNEMHQDPAQIAMGLNILKRLPGHDDCQSLLGRYLESLGEVGFLKPSIKNILDSLFTLYQPHLAEPRTDHDLETISTDITRNGEDFLFCLTMQSAGWKHSLDQIPGGSLSASCSVLLHMVSWMFPRMISAVWDSVWLIRTRRRLFWA